jgi:hypothetical protein
MDWGVLYIIEKILKLICLKWVCMTHLDIWNTSYGQKNWPYFLAFRWRAIYRWKAFNKGYLFALDLISIRGLHAKLWAPKVAAVPILVILGLPFGSPGTKCHLDVGFVERHKVYYKGEGGGFPQVRVVVSLVSLVSLSSPWLVLAPKVLQLCTNHFVLVLCRSVWVVDAFHSS